MLSQFISGDMVGLSSLDYDFPEGIHAIGRLDNESEGLLILTTNKRVTRLLFLGEQPHKRIYLVKVKYEVSQQTLEHLRNGVTISARGGGFYTTTPCDVSIVEPPADLFANPDETPDYVPFTWLRISLTEGKYRQIRKMVAAVNHKCKRLIRTAIEDLELGDMQPSEVREIPEEEFFQLLRIDNSR